MLQWTFRKQCGCFELVHFSKTSGHLSSAGPEILTLGSHCLVNCQPILDCFIPNFQPILDCFIPNFQPILDCFIPNFQPILDCFIPNFQPILDCFIPNFQPILDYFIPNFQPILDCFIPNFQPILDCFIPNFKLKYEDSENIKAWSCKYSRFNLHQIKQRNFLGTLGGLLAYCKCSNKRPLYNLPFSNKRPLFIEYYCGNSNWSIILFSHHWKDWKKAVLY